MRHGCLWFSCHGPLDCWDNTSKAPSGQCSQSFLFWFREDIFPFFPWFRQKCKWYNFFQVRKSKKKILPRFSFSRWFSFSVLRMWMLRGFFVQLHCCTFFGEMCHGRFSPCFPLVCVLFFSLSCSHFSKEYRFVEFFSGEANVTWALRNWGLPGLCFDHVYGGRYNDFFEPAGYASLTSKFLDFELFFADWSFVLPTLAVLDSTAVNLWTLCLLSSGSLGWPFWPYFACIRAGSSSWPQFARGFPTCVPLKLRGIGWILKETLIYHGFGPVTSWPTEWRCYVGCVQHWATLGLSSSHHQRSLAIYHVGDFFAKMSYLPLGCKFIISKYLQKCIQSIGGNLCWSSMGLHVCFDLLVIYPLPKSGSGLKPCHKVFRQLIWMRHFGCGSWKQTCLWSNSVEVRCFNRGPLSVKQKAEAVPLAHTYVDSRGRKRCVGKKEQLKSSQHLLLGLALFYFDTKRLLGPMEIYTIITVVSVLFVFLRAIEFQNTEGLHNGIWICCCCELLQDACWRLGSEKPTGLNDSTWVFFIPNVLCHWREKKRNRISFAITLMAFSCYTVCGGPTRRWHQCHPRVHDGRTFGWMEWWWSWICAYLSEGKQKFKCATLVAILFGDEQMKGARE